MFMRNNATKATYGGQAVLEGVMMKAPSGQMAVVCRKSDGSLAIEKRQRHSIAERYPLLRLPVLRGAASFVEALSGGVEILNFSAQVASSGTEGEEELSTMQMALATMLALALSVGLFMILPTVLLRLLPLHQWSGDHAFFTNLAEGALRLSIFLVYVLLVSQVKDIRRVFEYHGAEHKTIHCYEAGLELTPQNAAQFSALHPRCGTSFLLIVMVVSSLLFSLFGWPNLLSRILYRLALLPLVAGISYEVLRWTGRNQGRNALVDLLVWPGLQLQRLTTREPDEQQLEVALEALRQLTEG